MKKIALFLSIFLLINIALMAGGDSEAASAKDDDAPVEFIYAHNGPIRTLDAPVTWYGSTHWLTNLMYDALIWRKADGSGYVGQAAESWENIDPVTWRFHLREGITFHNGEPLDADAVKWNLDRVMTRKDFMVQPQWEFIKEVKVLDAVTVDIITHKPHAYFEYDVCYNGAELLPPKYIEEVGEEEFSRNPVGSGPYELVEMVPNEKYVFEAWEGYWSGRPEVDRIIYQVIPEKASQIAALMAGQIDLISNVPPSEIDRLASAPGVDIMTQTTGKVHLLYLRNEIESGKMAEKYPDYKPATLDKRIRQAISHALDRSVLADVQGLATPMLTRLTRFSPEVTAYGDKYLTEEAVDEWYDPDLAKRLIKEAGYDPDNGNKPKVYFDTPALYTGNEKEVAEIITVMLEEVGFDVQLNVYDRSAYFEQIHEPGYNRDIILETVGGSASLIPLFYTSEWWESVYHVDVPAWDKLSKEILVTVDPDERVKLWGEWWEYFMDYSQTVALYEINSSYGISDEFEWTPRVDGWMTFRDVRIKK